MKFNVIFNRPKPHFAIEAQGRSEFFIVRTLLKYAGSAELLVDGSAPEFTQARCAYRIKKGRGIQKRNYASRYHSFLLGIEPIATREY